MRIHKEGRPTLLIAAVFVIAANALTFTYTDNSIILLGVALVSAIFYFSIMYFFRVPDRVPFIEKGSIISPADGKVVIIGKTHVPEYFNDERIQVSIFMSPLNVHVNWYPMAGIIRYTKHHLGSKKVAWAPKASLHNERSTIVIENENGVQVLVRQIAGAMARRIVTYSKENERISQCGPLGIIKFGSRVDLFLPLNSEILVNLKENVTGSQTVIARLK